MRISIWDMLRAEKLLPVMVPSKTGLLPSRVLNPLPEMVFKNCRREGRENRSDNLTSHKHKYVLKTDREEVTHDNSLSTHSLHS